jgi:hypothetical protein
MPFPIPISHKFSCIALEGVSLDPGFTDPIDLGGGLWVVFDSLFELNGAWRDWLMEVLSRTRLLRCNLTLLAMAESTQPTILDDETASHKHVVRLILN